MGYLRLRRSIKLGPGVRMNLSKSALGISVGVRGARFSVNTAGRTYQSFGLPGTGVSYVATSARGNLRRPSRRVQQGAQPAALKKPGLFSPQYEKRYFEGLDAYFRQDFTKALVAFDASRIGSHQVSPALFAGIAAHQTGDSARAILLLEEVVQSADELPDQLMRKYLGNARVGLRISITNHVTAEVEADSIGAALFLAELYQEADRIEDAIGLIQQMLEAEPKNRALTLSLCDLLSDDQDYEGVIEAAAAVENDSDEALATLILKAKALLRLDMASAATSVLSEALRRSKPNPDLLKEARYTRAEAYEASGKRAMARKDWERLFAEDVHYRDVSERLTRS